MPQRPRKGRDAYLFLPEIEDREKAGRLMEFTFSEIARRAGIAEELIYATSKCGFILTEDNAHLFSQEDLDHWRAAIEEYRRNAGR